jgi:regulator of cell morphogenesis and NO signaling
MLIADLLLEHTECAHVLIARGFDLCDVGGRRFDDACGALALDPAQTFTEMLRAAHERTTPWAERNWPRVTAPALVAHIVDRHHGYLRDAAPSFRAMVEHLARAHPVSVDLRAEAAELFDTLDAHLDYEEHTLFPALMAHRGAAVPPEITRAFAVSHGDHAEIERSLGRLLGLTRGQRGPGGACTTWRVFARELDHFERDLRRHAHLEGFLLARFSL